MEKKQRAAPLDRSKATSGHHGSARARALQKQNRAAGFSLEEDQWESSDSPAAFLGTAPPVDAGALPQVEAAALLLSEDGALLTSKEGVDSNNSRLDGRQRKKKASWVPSKPLSAALLALLAVGLGASLGATSGLILNKLREGAPPVEGLPSEPPIQPEPPSDDEPFTWPPPPPSEVAFARAKARALILRLFHVLCGDEGRVTFCGATCMDVEVETKPFEALATKEEEERQQPPVRPLGEEGEPSKEDVRERLREPPAEREEKPVEKGEGELPEGFPEGEKPGIEPVPVEGTSGVPEGLPEEKTPGVEPVPVEDTSRGLDDVPLRRGSVGSISSDVLAEGFQHEDLYEDVEVGDAAYWIENDFYDASDSEDDEIMGKIKRFETLLFQDQLVQDAATLVERLSFYNAAQGDREDLLGLPTSAEEQGIPPMSESLVRQRESADRTADLHKLRMQLGFQRLEVVCLLSATLMLLFVPLDECLLVALVIRSQQISCVAQFHVVEPLISRLKETPFEKPKQPTEEDLRVLEEGLKRDGDHGTIVIGFVPLMNLHDNRSTRLRNGQNLPEEIRKFLLGHMTAIQLLDGYSTMLDDHLQQGFRLKYNEPVKVLNPSTLFFKWMQFTSTGKFDPFTERVVDMCVHAKKVMFAMPAPLGPPIGGKFTFPTGHYLVVVIDRELGLISVIDSFPQRKRAYYEVIGGFLKSVAGQLGRYAGHGDFRLSDYTPEPGFAIQAEAFTGGLDLGPEFSNACSIMCLENLAAIAEGRKPNFDIRDVKTLRQRVCGQPLQQMRFSFHLAPRSSLFLFKWGLMFANARELLYGLDDRRLEDGTTRPALDIVAL
ncbi:hypothetical protein Esti_004985 [Eimeria stiedai]